MERRCISSLQLGDESATESPVPLRDATPAANRESRDMDIHEHLGDGAPSYDD